MPDSDQDTVLELDLGYKPEAAVSGAVLLATEYSTVLAFNATEMAQDGQFLPAGYAIIEFLGCQITKFGYPNDEALSGHPLYPRLKGAYGIYEVLNSSWLTQLEQQNRAPFSDSGKWNARHFLITFHDSTFECLAE